jgi:predicted transcriptional regulator
MIDTTALHKYLFSIHMIVMKYRSRTDITVLILEAANGGATKTKIMYKSFLSYAQLKEYLTMLLENELLEYEETLQNFRTTEKGLHLLQLYNKIDSLIPNIRTS